MRSSVWRDEYFDDLMFSGRAASSFVMQRHGCGCPLSPEGFDGEVQDERDWRLARYRPESNKANANVICASRQAPSLGRPWCAFFHHCLLALFRRGTLGEGGSGRTSREWVMGEDRRDIAPKKHGTDVDRNHQVGIATKERIVLKRFHLVSCSGLRVEK